MQNFTGQQILIMGLGVQGGGIGAARYFARHGASVVVTDLKTREMLEDAVAKLQEYPDIVYHLGGHRSEDFTRADLIVKGPSVRWDNPYIISALEHGVHVIMETSYFIRHTHATVIGVTGTRGKSTTATWIYQALSKLSTRGSVHLAGNIPDTSSILLLDEAGEGDIVVLELSSWQLSGLHRERVSPGVAVFTNVYEDHLNYYSSSMQTYMHDKSAIFVYQKPGDTLILSEQASRSLKSYGILVPDHAQIIPDDGSALVWDHPAGSHNRANMLLVSHALKTVLASVPESKINDVLNTLKGIEFRQQVIFDTDNLRIINDATSSTPVALIAALETYHDRKIVLIMGGNSKNLSTTQLIETLRSRKGQIVSLILLAGSMTQEILESLQSLEEITVSRVYDDFDEAVREALLRVRQIDGSAYLLFSPGATSFAQFRNEFERGRRFTSLVSDIMKK